MTTWEPATTFAASDPTGKQPSAKTVHEAPSHPKPSDVVGTSQASELLGVDTSTLIRRIDRGEAPQPIGKLPGLRGGYIFNRAQVEALARGDQR